MMLILAMYLYLIRSNHRPFYTGWAFGLGYFCNALWWIYISLHDVGGVHVALSVFSVVALSSYLALTPAIALKLASCVKSKHYRIFAIASSWTLLEWFRSFFLTGFPWAGLAESQLDGPFFAIAPILGGLGATWLLVFTAGYLSYSRQKLTATLLVSLSIISLTHSLNLLTFTKALGDPLEVTLIQGNFAQSQTFNLNYIEEQITYYRSAIKKSNSTLVVAPETAFPINQGRIPDAIFDDLKAPAKHVLLGIIGDTSNGQYANSALGLSTKGSDYRYDKHHLVPFGEYVPPGFQWFVNAFHTPLGNFKRGEALQEPFLIHNSNQNNSAIAAGIMICYEDAFGAELAKRQRQSPSEHNLWINLTNLAWFGDSQAPEQQLRLARLRSLETGIPTVRATNTGVTAVINHQGIVTSNLPELEQGILETHIQPYSGKTPYVMWGDLPIVIFSLLTFLLSWFLSKRSHR